MMLGLYERLAPRERRRLRPRARADRGVQARDGDPRPASASTSRIATRRLRRAAVAGDPRRARRRRSTSAAPRPGRCTPDKGDTIWMGAIDADGLAVSFIQSVYWEYGSGCVLPRTGVLMQNRGVAFSLDPERAQSAAARAAAVPHAEPGARRVRRRPRAWPTARWAATASRSSRRRCSPASPPAQTLADARRRAAPSVRPHLGRAERDASSSRTATTIRSPRALARGGPRDRAARARRERECSATPAR